MSRDTNKLQLFNANGLTEWSFECYSKNFFVEEIQMTITMPNFMKI